MTLGWLSVYSHSCWLYEEDQEYTCIEKEIDQHNGEEIQHQENKTRFLDILKRSVWIEN